ncbi:MAG: hypothetical protein M1837_003420 [Sclerophora amabilis]|nr:MAG: hypothetical protein M1837_003420 [Sclerophora amabilis]
MDLQVDPRLRSAPSSAEKEAHHPPALPLPPLSVAENPTRLPLPRPRTERPPFAESARHLFYPFPPSPPSNNPPHDADQADPSHDPKRPRACEACRGLKVKCEPDLNNLDGPCRRCAKAKRSCVVTAPSRKRQKKTDSRVAELEKKIDALTATLHATKSATSPNGSETDQSPSHPPESDSPSNGASSTTPGGGHMPDAQTLAAPSQRDRDDEAARRVARSSRTRSQDTFAGVSPAPCVVAAGVKRRHSDDRVERKGPSSSPGARWSSTAKNEPNPESYNARNAPSIPAHPFLMPRVKPSSSSLGSEGATPAQHPPTSYSEYADVIDRRLLTSDAAARMFDRYVHDLAPHLPAVVFPSETTAAEVRKTKPILFLAILSVGSGTTNPELQRVLTKEIFKVLAERIMCNGEKSLEIVQAILVATIWYLPPDHHEELKFYQLIHIAAVMAVDIGMGRKYKKINAKLPLATFFRDQHPWRRAPVSDPESLDSRRAWLACYFCSASTSMSLRRPNLIRWTPYVDDCIECLESDPEAYPSDKLLCQWVRIQHIGEEIGDQFSMDDPCAVIGISDLKTQYALKGFERQFDEWNVQLSKECRTPDLTLNSHIINLYMHEVAMHVDHNVDDFKPPFTEDAFKAQQAHSDLLTPVHISALTTCLSSIHTVIDIFMSFDVHTIRELPIFNFVRVAYTLVVLIKLYSTATAPNSELGKVFRKEDMKVEHYLYGLLGTFRTAAEDEKCRPASKFLMILMMLKTWFQKSQKGSSREPFKAASGMNGTLNDGGYGGNGLESFRKSEQSDAPRSMQTTGSASQPLSSTNYPQILSGAGEGGKNDSSAPVTVQGVHGGAPSPLSNANTPLQMLSEVAMGSSGNLTDASTSNSNSNGIHQMNRMSNDGRGQSFSTNGWYSNYGADQGNNHPAQPSVSYPMAPPTQAEGGGGGIPENVNHHVADFPNDFSDFNMGGLGDEFGQGVGMISGNDELSSLFVDGLLFGLPMNGSVNTFADYQ